MDEEWRNRLGLGSEEASVLGEGGDTWGGEWVRGDGGLEEWREGGVGGVGGWGEAGRWEEEPEWMCYWCDATLRGFLFIIFTIIDIISVLLVYWLLVY